MREFFVYDNFLYVAPAKSFFILGQIVVAKTTNRGKGKKHVCVGFHGRTGTTYTNRYYMVM